jgi:hypothetical protein
MIEVLLVTAAFAWFFFVLFSKKFDYLDRRDDDKKY